MNSTNGKVFLVGAGPGDPGLLTLKAARALASCEVLVYDYLASEPIVALAPSSCERIYVGKKAGAHTLSQDEITALLVRLGQAGKRVVRLKGGDVFIFARGGEEARALREAGIAFEIVPGITSAIAAPAYAGIPVTHRAHNTVLTIATGHEDPAKGASSLDFAKLANPAQTLVLLMAMGNLPNIVERLIAHGLPASTPTAVVREGTRPQQATVVATLGTIVAEIERTGIAAPAIVVIGEVVREREHLRSFDTHPLFGKRVLLTRPADRSEELASRLRELGAIPAIVPAIEIAPPDDPAAAERAVRDARAYDWIVFTSRTGVERFFAQLAALGRDARALGDVRVASIGTATAEALAAHGVRADYLPDTFTGEALAEGLLARTSPSKRVLIYRAQEARDVLPDALLAAGRTVDVVAAYRTIPVRSAALAHEAATCDVWLFASASAVRAVVNALGDQAICAGKFVVCIGPITAQAARDVDLHVSVTAGGITADELLLALERFSPN